MHTTNEINAIVNKAKQDRVDFIAEKVQGGILPVALATLVSLALVGLSADPSQEQVQPSPVVEASAQLG